MRNKEEESSTAKGQASVEVEVTVNMEIHELLEILKELRKKTTSLDTTTRALKAYLEFEIAQEKRNLGGNPQVVQFHRDNAAVVNVLLNSLERSLEVSDALIYYYGHVIFAYMSFNGHIVFRDLIQDCQNELSSLEPRGFSSDLLTFFAWKHMNSLQRIVFDFDDAISRGVRINDCFLLCRMIIFDDVFMQTLFAYRNETRPGHFVVYDMLCNRLAQYYPDPAIQTTHWKERYSKYCAVNSSSILEYYKLYSHIVFLIAQAKIDQNSVATTLGSFELPRFNSGSMSMTVADLLYLYALLLIAFENICDFVKISLVCGLAIEEMNSNADFNNRWLFEYFCRCKIKALEQIEVGSSKAWFMELLQQLRLENIGTLAFLSPYLDFKEEDCDVYHFTDVNALKSLIEKNQLWLTRYDYLNDTEEMKYVVGIIRELLLELKDEECVSYINKCLEVLEAYFRYGERSQEPGILDIVKCIKKIMARVYVLSTSLLDDNLSLWHYYSGGTGASIRLNSTQLKRQIEQHNGAARNNAAYAFMRRISYMPGEDRSEAIALLKNLFTDSHTLSIENKLLLGCVHILCEGIFIKNSNMSQETEFRMVVIVPDTDSSFSGSIVEEFRVRNQNSITPFIKANIDPVRLIKGICIAPLNKSDLAKRGLVDFLTSKGFENPENMVKLSGIKLRY